MSEDIDAGPVAFGAAEALHPDVEQKYRKQYDDWTVAHRDKKIDEVVQQLQNLKPKTNKFTPTQMDKLGEIVPSGEAVNAAFKTTNETYAKRIEELDKQLRASTDLAEIARLKDRITSLEDQNRRIQAEADAAIVAAKAAVATAGGGAPASPPPEATSEPGMFGTFVQYAKNATGIGGKTAAPSPGPPAVTVTPEIATYRTKYLYDRVMEQDEAADNVPRGTYYFDHTTGKLSNNGTDFVGRGINNLKQADTFFTDVMRAKENVRFTVSDDGGIQVDFASARMFDSAAKDTEIQKTEDALFEIISENVTFKYKEDEGKLNMLTKLVKKGALYDEMMNNGLIYGGNYVGGFYDHGVSPETSEERLQTALKLVWVVLTSTAGKMKLGNIPDKDIKSALDAMRDDVTSRLGMLGLTETRGGQELRDLTAKFNEMIAAAMGDFSLVGVGEYAGVPEKAKEDKGAFFSLKCDARYQRKVLNAITSFLMTARDDAKSPYASIAEIAWQFHKIRSHVIDALRKKHVGVGHVPDPNIAKGTIAFSAGEGFDAIVSRMAMKFL